MSFIGGYQSNTNLNDLNFVGDFPIDHAIGGFGIGIGKNDYEVTLNTMLTQYRQGLLLELVFSEVNDGPVTINVSKCGLKPLQKTSPEGLQALDAGDINTFTVYLAVYDGQGFQVVSTLLNSLIPFKPGKGIGAIVPRLGEANEALGNFAAVLYGENNHARRPYSIANGFYAVAGLFNEWAKAGGAFFKTPGSAQGSILNLMATITPDQESVKLTPDGNENGDNRWLLPDNCIQQFQIQLTIAQNSGGTGAAGFAYTTFCEGTLRCQKGVATWVGKEPHFGQVHQDEGFDPGYGISIKEREVLLYVKSMPERVLHANATVFVTQTKFSLK